MSSSNTPPPTPTPPPPKSSASSILSPVTPRATRYRKTLIYGGTAAAGIAFGLMLAYGLTSGQHAAATKGPAKVTKTAATDRYAGNPNYNGVTKAIAPPASYGTAAKATTTPTTATTTPLAPVHTVDKTSPTDKARLLAEKKALGSNIFFTSTAAPGTPALGQQTTSSAAPNTSASDMLAALKSKASGGIGGLGGSHIPHGSDQGLTQQKNAFIAKASSNTGDYVNAPEQAPISPYEIQAGTIIPAALITGIDSNLPGEVIAQVSQNVYNSATGRYVLIPQGTRMIGQYDSLVGFAQNRALIVWNRLILPNGNSINLGGMIGTNQSGESGLHDKVNAHNLALFAALGAATLLSIGPQLALNIPQNSSGSTNIYTSPAENLGNEANSLGQDLVNRQLDRPNTIRIRPGWPLNVLVNKDMVMKPYSQ